MALHFGHDAVGVSSIPFVPIYSLDEHMSKMMISCTTSISKMAAIPFTEGKTVRSWICQYLTNLVHVNAGLLDNHLSHLVLKTRLVEHDRR